MTDTSNTERQHNSVKDSLQHQKTSYNIQLVSLWLLNYFGESHEVEKAEVGANTQSQLSQTKASNHELEKSVIPKFLVSI